MIPSAARADSENLGGAVRVRISARVDGEDKHPSPSLGHSEPLSVENPVGPPVPEVPHLTEETPKVSTGIAGEEAGDVLKDEGVRSVSLHKVEECEGEDGSLTSEPGPLAGDR